MEKEIINLIGRKGPVTGSEIWQALGGDGLILWRTCKLSQNLEIRTVGRHYLRLDRRMKGFARLSPSLLREFLTYSVVGFSRDRNSLEQRALAVNSHIEKVSRAKMELAYQVAAGLVTRFESEQSLNHPICFIIAGDNVHNMAHDVPRPERSTGRVVNGSDMDIVVILDDNCPDELAKRLDTAIYREKHRLLMAPQLKEEIDYVVKKMERVREQVRFRTFSHMLACKILHEGTLLLGDEDMFHSVKALLRDEGVTERISVLERKAKAFRKDAEEYLLHKTTEAIKVEHLYLFYPTEEAEEFE
jgi:hypothetical protein